MRSSVRFCGGHADDETMTLVMHNVYDRHTFFLSGDGFFFFRGRKASQSEMFGSLSLGGRLSAFATAAARLVVQRPIVMWEGVCG